MQDFRHSDLIFVEPSQSALYIQLIIANVNLSATQLLHNHIIHVFQTARTHRYII